MSDRSSLCRLCRRHTGLLRLSSETTQLMLLLLQLQLRIVGKVVSVSQYKCGYVSVSSHGIASLIVGNDTTVANIVNVIAI